ncbi:MAG: hypothetical protein QOI15_1892, partial [Pseudonocardiales bacterium]|nr:hypothetical protein [Pseudonocardiales bacterium]
MKRSRAAWNHVIAGGAALAPAADDHADVRATARRERADP